VAQLFSLGEFAIMDINTKRKIIYFVAALALYFVVAGADVRSTLLWRTTKFYVIAAIFAFWVGGKPFGVYHKMTARPLYIWVGAFMMVCMFILMLFLKEALHHYDRAP
jgi:drug/metabolite transporter (DMT)-like permease